jgi:hypothetical protein
MVEAAGVEPTAIIIPNLFLGSLAALVSIYIFI